MFESEFDNNEVVAAAPAPSAAVAVARARRGGVAAHTELSKVRIKLAFATRSVCRQKAIVDRLTTANFA